MKIKISAIAIISLAVLLVACSKDSYNTKPTLKILSVSSDYISFDGEVVISVQMTDKQGDFPGGVYTCKAVRQNEKPLEMGLPDYPVVTDSLIPDANGGGFNFDRDYPKAVFDRRFTYSDLHRSGQENDTLKIYFTLCDRRGNQSDTVYTKIIVVEKS